MELKAFKNESTGRWTLEGVEPSEKTFDRICQMLRDGENFKFARFGDGEAACMLGKIGKNCDGHEYFPDLGMALNDAFYSNPKYMVGIQPLMVQQGTWDKLISQREGYPKNIYDADVLHSASIDGRLGEFINACNTRNVILVGPSHLSELAMRNEWDFVQIPNKNCWLSVKETIREILEYTIEWSVILICASMASEYIIHWFRDYYNALIDCGSVFDPYVGKLSRSYHHKLKLNAN